MSIEHPDWCDSHSDQPYRLKDGDKSRVRSANLLEYARTGLTALALSPLIAWRYATLHSNHQRAAATDFVGLGVSPDHGDPGAVSELVEELGVKRLLLRVPSWHVDRLDEYLDFAARFPAREFLINILQSRDSVKDPAGWAKAVETIVDAFTPLTQEFQLGNAINRSKWGCRHSGDYLSLLDAVADLPMRFHNIVLAGSSVIDFEPLVTLRTLINRHRYRLDACSCALYVNRRGSPRSTQYGVFDLARKIRLIGAMTALSNRSANRLWITEANWPLLDTRPYTPNSGHPRSTVDEATQAQYLTDYYQLAYATGLVERVYWWQLVNPGYGLVDHRGGQLRKMPSFTAFGRLLSNGKLGT
ncbi:MAG TPA: hypothetical protein DF863_09580 [Gammaproteobacteria bacterium]|nr:hypothetical protein [Gammaproteobacteria bacterium]